MLIRCPKCDAANDTSAIECGLCHHPLSASITGASDATHVVYGKPGSLKRCRTCGKTVAVSAKTCPHCGASAPTVDKGAYRMIVGVIGFFALCVFLCCSGVLYTSWPSSKTPAKSRTDDKSNMAYVMVQGFVEDRLVSPATADWAWFDRKITYLGGGRYRVRSYVDSQNALGAMVRTNVDAVIKWVGDDKWTLETLTMD